SMKLLWDLGNERVFKTHTVPPEQEIHNRWVAAINAAFKQDRSLTNKARFGDLASNKRLVLDTWSGVLLDEDSLLDDWTRTKGVSVGIRPITLRNEIG
ncbi:hypothetical protein C8R45DRAFT_825919, partial [Mycena sanguinolenta]